jgi:hypothetical protein
MLLRFLTIFIQLERLQNHEHEALCTSAMELLSLLVEEE